MKRLLSFLATAIWLLLSISFRPGYGVDEASQRSALKAHAALHPRLDPFLIALSYERERGGEIAARAMAKTRPLSGISADGDIRFLVEASDGSRVPILESEIRAFGGRIWGRHGVQFDVSLPLSSLPLLSKAPGLRFAGEHLRPHVNAIVGEQQNLMKATAAQTVGASGSNVRVAIIDLGFSNLSPSIAGGELPTNCVKVDFTGVGLEVGEVHGTAVAEIIHEMAPQANLYLLKIANSVQLGQAIDFCKTNGVRVINHSVGWFNTSFGDGTGAICNLVQSAHDAGIFWVNSAGNEALSHYQASFSGTALAYHSFSPGNTYNELGSYAAGEVLYVYLCWNEAWGASRSDFDLIVYEKNGAQWSALAQSAGYQTGTQNPTEAVALVLPRSGEFAFSVKHWGGSTARTLNVFASSSPAVRTSPNSMPEPANASKAFTVGAVNQSAWASGSAETFSSRGPTQDGRTKPELVGVDGMTNFTYGRFFGTSAAAPSVAGLAALILGEYPGYSVSDLKAHLLQTASNTGLTGGVNDIGAGRGLALLPPVGVMQIRSASGAFAVDSVRWDWSAALRGPRGLPLQAQLSNHASASVSNLFACDPTNFATVTAVHGESWNARLIASNAYGLLSTGWAAPVLVDQTAPPTPVSPRRPAAVCSSNLSWSWPAALDGESGIIAYRFVTSHDPSFSQIASSNGWVTATNLTLLARPHGETLYARVRGVNGAGLESPWSAASEAVLVDALAPTSTISPETAGARFDPLTVSITANEPGANIYVVLGSPTPANPFTPYQGPFVLSKDTEVHYYSVDPIGNREPENRASFRFVAKPATSLAAYNNRLIAGQSGLRLVVRDGGTYRLSVYDAFGRKAVSFEPAVRSAGENWEWDGQVRGKYLARGLYYLQVEAPDGTTQTPFLVENSK